MDAQAGGKQPLFERVKSIDVSVLVGEDKPELFGIGIVDMFRQEYDGSKNTIGERSQNEI